MIDETKKKSIENQTTTDWKCNITPGALIVTVIWKIWWGHHKRLAEIVLFEPIMDHNGGIVDRETAMQQFHI